MRRFGPRGRGTVAIDSRLAAAIGAALLLATLGHCRLLPYDGYQASLHAYVPDSDDELDRYAINGRVADSSDRGERDKCMGATCELRSSCGEAPLNDLTRKMSSFILNGQSQQYGEWPSFAKIEVSYINDTSDSIVKQICGGIVLSNRHVLTAGHCVHNGDGVKVNSSLVEVTVGEHSVRRSDEMEAKVEVGSICVAREYKLERQGRKVTVSHDTAVLTLKRKLDFNQYCQPACLPYEHIDVQDSRLICYLVGVGATGYTREGKPVMAQTVMKMRVRQTSCNHFGFYRDETRECYTKAKSEGNSCNGDSGGPILCLEPESRRWTAVGAVSYGPKLCNGTTKTNWTFVAARITTLLPSMKRDCGL